MMSFMSEPHADVDHLAQTACDVLRSIRDYTTAELVEIGHAIVIGRKNAGLNQVDIAETFGVDQATISRIERGLAQPSPRLLLRIAEHVGADTTSIVSPFLPALAATTAAKPHRPTRRRRPDLAAAS